MDAHWEEHCDFNYTSEAEWDRAAAREIGAMHPDRAWVLSDRDVWYPNPFYTGPKAPHPEDEYYLPEGQDMGDEFYGPFKPYDPNADEIPF